MFLMVHKHTYIIFSTGRAGWGYSWIINDTLIPHLIVSRGYTYTFISEGGDDPSNPGQYHPFYLTSSVIGGRLKNNEAQKEVGSVQLMYIVPVKANSDSAVILGRNFIANYKAWFERNVGMVKHFPT